MVPCNKELSVTIPIMAKILRYYATCCAILVYTLLCYAMLCYAMLCYAMLCYAMLCYTNAIECYANKYFAANSF
jgi:hypothetical protein